MHRDAFDLDEALAILERAPGSLSALLAGLPETWIRATEGEATWSPHDVLVHLIENERANWLSRARHILDGDQRPFGPIDRTAGFAENRDASVDELLEAFAELRRDNLAALRAFELTSADLDRTGLHPEFGEVRLAQLLATWVVHDLTHVGQIVRTMAKRYTAEVGPWSAYLSILRDRERHAAV